MWHQTNIFPVSCVIAAVSALSFSVRFLYLYHQIAGDPFSFWWKISTFGIYQKLFSWKWCFGTSTSILALWTWCSHGLSWCTVEVARAIIWGGPGSRKSVGLPLDNVLQSFIYLYVNLAQVFLCCPTVYACFLICSVVEANVAIEIAAQTKEWQHEVSGYSSYSLLQWHFQRENRWLSFWKKKPRGRGFVFTWKAFPLKLEIFRWRSRVF